MLALEMSWDVRRATVSWHVHEARKRLKILLGRETV